MVSSRELGSQSRPKPFLRENSHSLGSVVLSPKAGARGPGTRGTDARRALRLVGRRLIISVVFVVLDVHLDGPYDGELSTQWHTSYHSMET